MQSADSSGKSALFEELIVHPDADAGTEDGDDKGAEAPGRVDADQTEQKLADKAAQHTQNGVAGKRCLRCP